MEKMKKVEDIFYGEEGIANRFRNGSYYVKPEEHTTIMEWIEEYVNNIVEKQYADKESLKLFYDVTTTIEANLYNGEDDSIDSLERDINNVVMQ